MEDKKEEPGFLATLFSVFKKEDDETTLRRSKTTAVTLRKKPQGAANAENEENFDQENNPNQ